MATSSLNCGVCDLRHISKLSVVWCTECDEGLCEGCQEHHSLSKGTRNHTVIPINEYHKLPSDVVKISQFCDKHDEKFSIYCKMHECPCCRNCIVESHNKCQQFSKLEDVINNVKSSNAFYEIEQTLEEVAENIEKIRQDRQNNLKTLPETRKQIEKEIQKTKSAINDHIDKIQADIIKELYASEDKESKKIRQLLNSLEDKQQEISLLQRSISDIKQHASDLQTFVSMKRIEKEVSGKNEYLNSISSNENLKQIVLSFNINTAIQNLISGIPNFGKIMVESKLSDIELSTNKQKQAQMMVTELLSRSFENISLKLQQTINTIIHENTTGTYLLPDGRMVLSNNALFGDTVIMLNANGSLDFRVKMSRRAFDVTHITKNNTLAVSCGDSGYKCICIIDMQNQKVEKTISVNGYNYGITYNGSNLVYSGSYQGIRMINPNDERVSDIVGGEMPPYCYVTTFGDKLYHTNPEENTVTCYDLHGEIQWRFQNESVLQTPRGISVDNDGNIYVVGDYSNNLIMISPDGKRHRQLLSRKEGLSQPWSIHFSKIRNTLIVANKTEKVFLYSVN
ncbi:uncharacterized protein LOC127705676 [Mytilus californianus]|uniref:uncharacterized protein LOC127705676 n=1 Tax=Mytilus californianus TaxID=6549 RepID=UPI0022479F7D|nr:uncharacterized protein LOC127705676 [Mytilus californianus]